MLSLITAITTIAISVRGMEEVQEECDDLEAYHKKTGDEYDCRNDNHVSQLCRLLSRASLFHEGKLPCFIAIRA